MMKRMLNVLMPLSLCMAAAGCKAPFSNGAKNNATSPSQTDSSNVTPAPGPSDATPAKPGGPAAKPATSAQPVTLPNCVLIPPTNFTKVTPPPGWGETIWYDLKPTGGLTSLHNDGIYFVSDGANSRSGYRFDIVGDHDLSRCTNLTLTLKGAVLKQALAGTGRDAREAPAAVVISYIDENGVTHASLNAFNGGEPDDRNSTRMFWRGFFITPSPGQEADGVRVESGKDFDFSLDLFGLTPRPKKILWVTLEGGGWHERVGLFRSISLAGGEMPPTAGNADTQDAQPISTACSPLAPVTFGKTLPQGWSETVWYEKKSSGGQVVPGEEGVTFKSLGANTRAGIRYDFADNDLSGCDSVYLDIKGKVLKQALTGTGLDAREAPLAIVISYKDEDGTDHTTLNAFNEGEPDDRTTTRMYWLGFYIIGGDSEEAGYKVDAGVAFDTGRDILYEFSKRPKRLNWIVIEGGGWHERVGLVQAVSITGTAKQASPEIIVSKTFGTDNGALGPDWVKTSGSYNGSLSEACQTGDVVESNDAVQFTSASCQKNNRVGVIRMWDGNGLDVSKYQKLTLSLTLSVLDQTLQGTGMDAREAPLAIAISYVDAAGTLHNTLRAIREGEPDDRTTSRMFWLGFYLQAKAAPAGGPYYNDDGIVFTKTAGEWDSFVLDFPTDRPRPAAIKYIVLEGAGWPSRSGRVQSFSLSGIPAAAL